MTTQDIDPIDLEIQWQRLIAIMDEVDNAVIRTSFSTIVGESHDFACILLDERGSSLCQSSFSPPDFCVILPRTAKIMLERFPVESLREGDVLFTNDPWLAAGHLPDYALITPIFHQGRVVAFMGTIAHVSDVGGHSGDIVAPDVFTEGVRIPPSKLYQAGEENELLFGIIGSNCRVPDLVLGDLRAIVGTHRVGARRLREFLDDYELPGLGALSGEILTRSEALLRRKIEALPDGRHEFGLDIDGYIDIVHLHATVEVRGSDIFVDYTGTSPQTRKAAINCVYNVTHSSTMYPFKCALASTIPNNEGLFRPIHVSAPEGCILNTTFPHPVQARAKTTNNINQVLFGAVWSLLGEHAQAGSGSIWPFSVSGEAPGYGRFSVHILPHGGRGSMRDLDGLVPIAFPHNSVVTPVEIMESRAPVLIGQKSLLPDSAGAGRRRGGLGQVMTVRNTSDTTFNARIRPDKIFCAPPGLAGGQPGRTGRVLFNDHEITEFPILAFRPGDEITMIMPGGAGFGPVGQRERQRILDDLRLGYITPDGARNDYGLEESAVAVASGGNGVKIVEVVTTIVSLPRSATLTTSYGSGDRATTVLVELHTDEGMTGIGQTAVAPRSYGETAEGILANIHTHLAPAVVGENPLDIERLNRRLQAALPHHWSSHAGVEMALWDLKGKALGAPLHQLLGGRLRPGLELMGFVHHDTPERMAAEVERTLAETPFPVLKMKIGLDPREDVARYRAVAEAVAGRATIQVDGNTGYTLHQAIPALAAMEGIGGLGAVEQPVARLEDMADLAARLDTPLMADEAIYPPEDAIEVVRRKAATVALMKITKHGGVLNVAKIGAIFEAAGLSLSIAIYYDLIAVAAAHLAAALPCATWPSPFTYLQDTLLTEPFEPDGLTLAAPTGPGLGVAFDPAKVRTYSVDAMTYRGT